MVSIDFTTPSILSIHLEKSGTQKPFAYLPGQYATISFYRKWRKSAVRCFSIASSPLEQPNLEFGIRIAGSYTKALTKLKAGDLMDVSGPFGNFIFEPENKTHMVMCAGGIGVTPFMSMVRYATKLKLDNKITLILSARNKVEVPYLEELKTLTEKNKHLKVMYVTDAGDLVMSKSGSSKVYSGRISEEVLNDAVDGNFSEPRFYLCGPPPFMKSLTTMLKQKGVDQSRIVTEAFSQGQSFKTGDSRDWPSTVYFAGAFGTIVASMMVLAGEMLKLIPPTLLPETLSAERNQSLSARQQDIDSMVNDLKSSLSTANQSPTLTAAEKEVAEAEAKIATQNNSANSTTTPTPPSQAAPTDTITAQPTPVPEPTAPTCTTSASGVTTCQ